MIIDENINLLRERFLHLAQHILCNEEAAREVANNALNEVREKAKTEFSISWAQKILDDEIENFFQKFLEEIKADSEKAKRMLFSILDKRFSSLVRKKIINDSIEMTIEDANDIVQNALMTVHKKCRSAKPKGTFIQWAQTILANKYKEYRRAFKIKKTRTESLSQQDYEPIYTKKMSSVVSQRKSEKQVVSKEAEQSSNNLLKKDPFVDDPYDWSPSILIESKDLKTSLLRIVKQMEEPCKSVFKVLFSEGDIQAVHRQFSDLTRKQIDVMICRCRQKLKAEALKWSIL